MSNETPSLMPPGLSMPRFRLSPRERLRQIEESVRTRFRDRWNYQMSEPTRRKRTFWGLRFGGVALVVVLGLGGWWAFGPRIQPDYDTASMDDIFDYTLLSDDFNKLSIEDRLKLIGQLVNRMKNMSGDDSLLLAAFASGIAGSARRHLEENASKLAIDLWDKYAKDYGTVKDEDRDAYLEHTFIDFSKTMEVAAGQPRDISDADRINEVRRQAAKDRADLRDHPDRAPDGKMLGGVFSFMNNNVGSHASPQQKARGQLMMRDMARTFRGQDTSTGKPKDPSAPAPKPLSAKPGPK